MSPSLQFFHGKRVFITGHTGFKGAWLSEWLLALGAKVTGYSIDVPTQPSLFEILEQRDRIAHHFGDVNDLENLRRHLHDADPEWVFHLAAQPLVRLSYDQPVQTFATNVLGTVHVLEAMRELRHLRAGILITTDKVYEPGATTSFRETDRLGGHDPYSASKAAAEIVIQSYFRSFYRSSADQRGIVSARAGNVIGGGDYSADRLVPDAVRAWQAGTPLVIRSPEAVRPWQHVLEPLSGYLALALRVAQEPAKFSGESYNFGPPEERGGSVEEVTGKLRERWKGFEVQVDRSQTGTKKETQVLRLNWDKAKRDLGWSPKLPLGEALEWTAAWYETVGRNPAEIRSFTRRQIDQYMERFL